MVYICPGVYEKSKSIRGVFLEVQLAVAVIVSPLCVFGEPVEQRLTPEPSPRRSEPKLPHSSSHEVISACTGPVHTPGLGTIEKSIVAAPGGNEYFRGESETLVNPFPGSIVPLVIVPKVTDFRLLVGLLALVPTVAVTCI